MSCLPPSPGVLDRSKIAAVGHRREGQSSKEEAFESSLVLAFLNQRQAKRHHTEGCSQLAPTMTALTSCLGGSTAAFHSLSEKLPEQSPLATVRHIVRH